MKTRVYSEIGRLKKVMVHAPGREVDVITPNSANELLFEDILFGELARHEHEIMCKVLIKYGVEIYDILDMLIDSISEADKKIIKKMIAEIKEHEGFSDEVEKQLLKMQPSELGHALIEGIMLPDEEMDDDKVYALPPVPNLLFARDPVIMCHDKILASCMAEGVRTREARLMVFIFNYHPELKSPESIIDLNKLSTDDVRLTLEGGDFLVIDEKTVAIAWSKRTSLESIKVIARELKNLGVKNLVVSKLPPVTAFIHLDTTFTRINHDECLFYPPLYAKDSKTKVDILYFDLTQDEFKEKNYDYILDVFSDLGISMKPIFCGGRESLISQKREQWTQGANSVCIAPGIIMTYSRNINTAEELAKAGYLCISAEEVLKPTFKVNMNQKTAILLKGEELCRARGGPRCLTHPLVRN